MSSKPGRQTISLRKTEEPVDPPTVAPTPIYEAAPIHYYRPWPSTVLAPEAPPPARGPVKLGETVGFVNDYGAVYLREAGSIVVNPIEIAMLTERGALLEDV